MYYERFDTDPSEYKFSEFLYHKTSDVKAEDSFKPSVDMHFLDNLSTDIDLIYQFSRKLSGKHHINPKVAEQWINSQTNTYCRYLARLLYENTIYITLDRLITEIPLLVQKIYAHIDLIDPDRSKTLILSISSRNKSNYFMAVLFMKAVNDLGLRKPDLYARLNDQLLTTHHNSTSIFIQLDDMMYTGNQNYKSMKYIFYNGLTVVNFFKKDPLIETLKPDDYVFKNYSIRANTKDDFISKFKHPEVKFIEFKIVNPIYLISGVFGMNNITLRTFEQIGSVFSTGYYRVHSYEDMNKYTPIIYLHLFPDLLNPVLSPKLKKEQRSLYHYRILDGKDVLPTLKPFDRPFKEFTLETCQHIDYLAIHFFFSCELGTPVSIYFDHKIADAISTFKSTLLFGPIVPNYHNMEALMDWNEFLFLSNIDTDDLNNWIKILKKVVPGDTKDTYQTRLKEFQSDDLYAYEFQCIPLILHDRFKINTINLPYLYFLSDQTSITD